MEGHCGALEGLGCLSQSLGSPVTGDSHKFRGHVPAQGYRPPEQAQWMASEAPSEAGSDNWMAFSESIMTQVDSVLTANPETLSVHVASPSMVLTI